MKKILLTKNGVLAPQTTGKWAYFSNSGEFRRECLLDEADFLSQQGWLVPCETSDYRYVVSEMPAWHLLWSVEDRDDSSMIGSLANNGGAYGHRVVREYYAAKMPNEHWAIRVVSREYSTAEFFQDDAGRYCNHGDCVTTAMANTSSPVALTYQGGVTMGDDGYPVHNIVAVLEQHSELTTLESAISDAGTYTSSPYTWDGQRDGDSETTENRPTFSLLKERLNRLSGLGIERVKKPRKGHHSRKGGGGKRYI